MKTSYQRAAVALNNIGVDFIQRKLYHDAWVTLQDATTLMKASFAPPQKESPLPVADMLDRASKRACGSLRVPLTPNDSSLSPIRIHDVHQAALSTRACFYTDDVDELQAAVILYNFALSILFALQGHDDLLDHPRYLFQLASDILRNVDTEEDLTLSHQVLTLSPVNLAGIRSHCPYSVGTRTNFGSANHPAGYGRVPPRMCSSNDTATAPSGRVCLDAWCEVRVLDCK